MGQGEKRILDLLTFGLSVRPQFRVARVDYIGFFSIDFHCLLYYETDTDTDTGFYHTLAVE